MIKDNKDKFQWGDRYIKSEEVIPNLGGKYWRWNGDGTITEFKTKFILFETVKSVIVNHAEIKKYKVLKNNRIKFKSESDAIHALSFFNDDFWNCRNVECTIEGRILNFNIGDDVTESTYTPATSS